MQKTKIYPNGLKLVVTPLANTEAVTLLILVKVGSRYESAKINGVSHFVEHLMFKGTKKRPSTLLISQELDSVGAEYNAFTSKDYTGYYIKVDSLKIDLAVDMLTDMLMNSTFSAEEIERERGVIIEEIKMYEDNPLMYIEDVFEETMFGADQPLGRHIAGPKEIIAKVTRKEIINYRDNYYVPNNMVVSVAGKVNVAKLEKLLKISGFLSQPKFKKLKKFLPAKVIGNKPKIQLVKRKTEQIQLCLGFPAYSYTDKNLPALNLLSVILGGNMSSRLFIEVRERRGLAYFVRSNISSYEDTGVWYIHAGLDPERFSDALRVILSELLKVRDELVTAEELKKAKQFVRGKLVLQMEDSDAQAQWYGRSWMFKGKIIDPEKELKRLEKVTVQDILKVTKALIASKRLSVAVIGPLKNDSIIKSSLLLK